MKKIIFSIVPLIIIFTIISCVKGNYLIFGYKKNEVAFNDLTQIQKEDIQSYTENITQIKPTISKITKYKYKNDLETYILELEGNNIISVSYPCFYKLNAKHPESNSDTGYYFKKGKTFLVICKRDYSLIKNETYQTILYNLEGLNNTLNNIFTD